MRSARIVIGLVVVLVVMPSCTLFTATATVTPANHSVVVPEQALAYTQAGQVWIAEADGSNPQALTSTAAQAYHPLWIPNTDTLVYGRVREPYFELWSHNLLTGELRLLTAARTIQQKVQIAPNGQFLTYVVGSELYLLNLGDGSSRRLDEQTTYASWSPDSRTMLFSTSDDRLLRSQFRATGELDPAEVLLTQAVTQPSWVNNHTIQFVTKHDTLTTLDQYDIKTGSQTILTTFSDILPDEIVKLDVTVDSSVLVLLVDGILEQYPLAKQLDNKVEVLASGVTTYSLASNSDLLYYTQANTATQLNRETHTTLEWPITTVTDLISR